MDRAVRKAAKSLMHDFGEVEHLQVSVKGPGDFVSTADLQAERILRAELGRARPDFGFLMEESGERQGPPSPLDRRSARRHHQLPPRHPAILHLGRRSSATASSVAGVIYDPLRDEMFYGEKGVGAYVNDRRLRVSARNKLDETVIGTGIRSAPAATIRAIWRCSKR